MFDLLKLYAVTLVVLLALDSLWLGIFAKQFYAKFLGYLMAPQINFLPAVLFYFIYAIGLVYFVINPALKNGSVLSVLFAGAFLGLLAYAAYDLTNHATIKNWPWQVTIVDMLWGTLLSALVATIVFLLFKK